MRLSPRRLPWTQEFLAGLCARQLSNWPNRLPGSPAHQDPQLTDQRRADLTIDVRAPGPSMPWPRPPNASRRCAKRVSVAEDSRCRNPSNSKLLLVRFQGLLAAVAQERLRSRTPNKAAISGRRSKNLGEESLRPAISQLRALDEQIGQDPRRNPPPRGKQDIEFRPINSRRSSGTSVISSPARCNQGLCYWRAAPTARMP